MPSVGKSNPLVDILHQKTKIKKEDISDVLKVLPESIVEAFFAAELPPTKGILLGGVSISWSKGQKVMIKASRPMKERIAALKRLKNAI